MSNLISGPAGYDPVLGEMRTNNAGGGGGGGGDYVGRDGVIVSGSTIRANTATADELVSGTTATKLVTANAYRTLNHDEPVVFSGSTASLAANTEFEFCDEVHLKKDEAIQVYFEFTGDFGTFDIKHDYGEGLPGRMLRITSTAIELYTASGLVYTYNHGLTITTFLNVEIKTRYSYYNNVRQPLATITLTTLSGSYTKYDFFPLDNYGNYVVVSSFAVSNLVANYIAMDARKKIWVFGDSYTELRSNGWPIYLPYNMLDSVAFFGFSGAKSPAMLANLQLFIAKSRPDYIVWALGMNEGDTESGYNATWKSALDTVEQICSANAVQLILVTIPNTPIANNTQKNAYIHSLDYPVIDFALAVNADTAGATWYAGMLKEDQLHPTALGAQKLADAFTQYFVEAFYLSDVGVVANEVTQDLRENIIRSIPVGYGLTVSGGTFSQNRFVDIEQIDTATLNVKAGHSYAGTASSILHIAVEGFYATTNGLDAHLSVLFTDGSALDVGSSITLLSKLEPLALNNMTIRFRAGHGYLSLDDCIGGYIVNSTSGSTAGTLAYGLTASDQYICFDPAIDGSTVSFGTVTTYNGEKYIHGNGKDKTFVSGSVSCSKKVVMSNLALANVAITGGTFKLGNVAIPAGSTVSLTGDTVIDVVNGLTVNGPGTLDFGLISRSNTLAFTKPVSFHGLIITNGLAGYGGFVRYQGSTGSLDVESCEITGNTATSAGVIAVAAGTVNIKNCYLHDNKTPSSNSSLYVFGSSTVNITGGTFSSTEKSQTLGTSSVSFFDHVIWTAKMSGAGTTKLKSGVTFDMTGNANSDVITGGTLIVEDGASVITTGGSTVALTGGTYSKLHNDGTLS